MFAGVVDGEGDWTRGTETSMHVERHVTGLPAGECLPAGVAAHLVSLARVVEACLGQRVTVDGCRRPARPQHVGPASDGQLVHVATLRVQRHVAAAAAAAAESTTGGCCC